MIGRSPLFDEYGPTSAIREADLFRGYSPPRVSRPCRCGERITSLDTPDEIQHAVEVHGTSPAHESWARSAGLR